jgi:hypothetical protein
MRIFVSKKLLKIVNKRPQHSFPVGDKAGHLRIYRRGDELFAKAIKGSQLRYG